MIIVDLAEKLVPDWKPTKLNDLKNITDIVAGGKHSFALSNSGQLYGWGDSTEVSLVVVMFRYIQQEIKVEWYIKAKNEQKHLCT